ncbi:MAG: fructose-1,6-bisphosphate aldolase [Candidatus Kerfeldbacteria bacterium CG15_BIG_FIL_POST_REV_8_21_14_020_45_12]|uniref:fructose-bisphosphate aldolase n=1 Tax=Candidatus Kerfeldbacteria bacterium CG15_BIG_FIL_POST_REV_8_21_14_020_45_12 TaxID=2014247 RepID=A0A2M7H3N6_9BACT|nr:MAG: fructose-1,6-bisphosphate aldolase [Candidatus Kerfeldbacteria bacterium CG15_BIG_FIL_POST_REV_8_21_14_020_45_12]PJA93464.1 MAG: fructose-1,6-bisphosphate aldolase [Candidatus Kerfeldbacteria bacterium CG_4_9_14_3_um_filter_45_8]
MLVPAKIILDHAFANSYAVGAFNVNNMEQVQAIIDAAAQTQSPVIIQVSRGALEYSRMTYLRNLIQAAAEEHPEIPVAMHLDHGNGLEVVKTAIDLGFTSVMIDGSLDETAKKPNTFEQNLAVTQAVLKYARPFGVTVEAELGTLGGIEDGVGSGHINVTDPDEAIEFIAKAPVDSLAIAIGTSHGAYKFSGECKLAYDVLEEIHSRLPEQPIVMHGSSSVPQELIAEINKYGGQMPNARGVDIEALQKAIPHGVAKINVDTDGRLAVTAAIRKVLVEHPEEFDPRKYLGAARDALTEVIALRMQQFGAAGNAPKINQIGLTEAKELYS